MNYVEQTIFVENQTDLNKVANSSKAEQLINKRQWEVS